MTEYSDQVPLDSLTEAERSNLDKIARSEDLDATDYVIRRVGGEALTYGEHRLENLTTGTAKEDH